MSESMKQLLAYFQEYCSVSVLTEEHINIESENVCCDFGLKGDEANGNMILFPTSIWWESTLNTTTRLKDVPEFRNLLLLMAEIPLLMTRTMPNPEPKHPPLQYVRRALFQVIQGRWEKMTRHHQLVLKLQMRDCIPLLPWPSAWFNVRANLLFSIYLQSIVAAFCLT